MEEDPHCVCAGGKFGGDHIERTELGSDEHHGEVTLMRCRVCRRLWLHYYYINDFFTASGRWYHGLVSPELEPEIKLETAYDIFSRLEWYWCGGSFFFGKIFRRQGKLDLFP